MYGCFFPRNMCNGSTKSRESPLHLVIAFPEEINADVKGMNEWKKQYMRSCKGAQKFRDFLQKEITTRVFFPIAMSTQ